MSTNLKKLSTFYKRRFNGLGTKQLYNFRKLGLDDINLISNDYLCISDHPKIVDSMCDSLIKPQPMMSTVFSESFEEDSQASCEAALADHVNKESVLLYQSGYMANVGLLQSICSDLSNYPFLTLPKSTDQDDRIPVYIDSMAHASLHEGVAAGRGNSFVFPHNDVKSLDTIIQKNGPGIIVVDSIYSNDGSMCPLADVVRIRSKTDSVLVVDESHSFGLYGDNGGTLVENLGLTNEVDFKTASLSKAFVSRAGIIACSEEMKEALNFSSYPAVFSSALLHHDVAGIHAALVVIKESKKARKDLTGNSNYLKQLLKDADFDVTESLSQIIAIKAGNEEMIMKINEFMNSRGIFGAAFVPPATGRKKCIIRLGVNSNLSVQQLEIVADVCEKAKKIYY